MKVTFIALAPFENDNVGMARKVTLTLFLCILLTGCGTQSVDEPGETSIPISTVATEPPPATATLAAPPEVPIALPSTIAPTAPAEQAPGSIAPDEPVLPLEETSSYKGLPEIVLNSPVAMIASPSHPDSYLEFDPIPAGEKVRVLGRNVDGSWLLVIFRNALGWICSICSGTGTGTLKLAEVRQSVSESCAGYLGATLRSGQSWFSRTEGMAVVQGLIYRPQPEPPSDNVSLRIAIGAGEQIITPEFAQTPVTAAGDEILQFMSPLENLQQESPVILQLIGLDREPTAFQAAFYNTDCATTVVTDASAPTEASGFVSVEALDVWSGPRGNTDIPLGKLAAGETVRLTGYSTDASGGRWWRVLLPSGQAGWIDSELVEESGCIDCVPEVPKAIVLHVTSQVSSISRLVLINAVSDTEIGTLAEGSVIRLSQLETTKLNVQAVAGQLTEASIQSVRFYLDGQEFCRNQRCLENGPPYAMAGDLRSGDYYDNWDWARELLPGRHTISAIPCDQDNGEGNCGLPLTIIFTIER